MINEPKRTITGRVVNDSNPLQNIHPSETLPDWVKEKLKKEKTPISWVICWSVLKDQETINVSFGRQLDYSSGFYKEVKDDD